MIELERLTLQSLVELDPVVEKLFAKHAAHLAHDLNMRPGDKSAREITLTFSFVPVADTNPDTGETDCSTARMSVRASSKVPRYQTAQRELRLNNKGFTFNRESPDRVDQHTLFRRDDDEDHQDV